MCGNVCAWSGYPFPPSKDHPHMHPISCVGNMLTLCTYNTNVSREPRLSKYRHVSQIMYNKFNKHIKIIMSYSWMKCSLNANLYIFIHVHV